MKILLETTEWAGSVPNHVYFVNDSRDRMFGYVPAATGVAVKFSTPIKFETRGRRFQAVPNQWAFSVEAGPAVKSWTVTGSRGDIYTVADRNGVLSCSCAGFQFRATCRHLGAVPLGV
jgi:hypothetical protein